MLNGSWNPKKGVQYSPPQTRISEEKFCTMQRIPLLNLSVRVTAKRHSEAWRGKVVKDFWLVSLAASGGPKGVKAPRRRLGGDEGGVRADLVRSEACYAQIGSNQLLAFENSLRRAVIFSQHSTNSPRLTISKCREPRRRVPLAYSRGRALLGKVSSPHVCGSTSRRMAQRKDYSTGPHITGST